MNKFEWEETYENVRKHYPDWFAVTASKKVIPPHNGQPYAMAVSWIMEAIALHCRFGQELRNHAERCEVMVAWQCLRHDMPVFYVTEELAEAVWRSKLPGTVHFSEMKMAHPGMMFMLPQGWGMNRFGFDLWMLNTAFVGDGEVMPERGVHDRYVNALRRGGLSLGTAIETTGDAFAACGVYGQKGKRPIVSGIYSATFPGRYAISEGLATLAERPVKRSTAGGVAIVEHEPEDDQRMAIITTMAIGLTLAITAAPSLIEHGEQMRKEKVKHGKTKAAIWSANVIGKNYRIERHGLPNGTHASPIMHWRRGHFRQQQFGLGRKLVKTIWIEPILVNAEASDE